MRNAVLITRPQPAADETAARVAALGFVPVVAPVLEIAVRPFAMPTRMQAVLVTSGNALPALPATLHDTPLLAVGDATAARASAAGFTKVHSAGRDAEALAELAASLCTPAGGALLVASGAGQGQALVADLRTRGFRVQRKVAYEATPIAALPEAARSALAANAVAAVLFFSPETAEAFVAMLQRDMPAASLRGIDALAISDKTETVLAALPWRRVRVASHPSQDELLGLLNMTEPTPPTQDETPPPFVPVVHDDPQVHATPAAPRDDIVAEPPRREPAGTWDEPAPVTAATRRGNALPVLTAAGFVLLIVLAGWLWVTQRDLQDQVAQLASQPPPAPPPPAPAPPPAATPAQVTSLEAKVADLTQRLTALQQRPAPAPPAPPPAVDLAPLLARLSALENRKPDTPPDTTTPLVQKLDSVVAETTAAKSADAAMADRLAELDARLKQAEQAQAAAIKQADEAVKRADEAVAGRLAGLDGRLQQAEQRQTALAAHAAQAQRVEQALIALDAGDVLGDMPGAPPALAKFAAAKPPTEAALRLSYPAAAVAAEKASDPASQVTSLTQKMLLRASGLVTVKQGDKVLVGPPAAAVLSDAHAQLEAGDLAGAVATLDKLDPAAAGSIAGWKGQAQALLDARAALAQMVRS